MSDNHRLPLLERVRIVSPCDVPWSTMRGDDRVRRCAQCDQDVYRLSSLTRNEAEALLQRHLGERLCVQLRRRADGTVITADCPADVPRRRAWRALSGLAAGALTSLVGLLACPQPAASEIAPEPARIAAENEAPAIPSVIRAITPPADSAPAGRRRDELAWPIATITHAIPDPPRGRGPARKEPYCAPGDGMCGF